MLAVQSAPFFVNRKSRIWAALGLLLFWGRPDLAAAGTTASFQVSATIAAGCGVDGVGTSGNARTMGVLDFGRDTTLSTAVHTASLPSNQAITLRCTPGVALTMTIDGGLHFANGVRHLQSGSLETDRLPYRLYSDTGFSQEIGISQSQAIAVTAANMNAVQLPVYGRLALPGGRTAGTYTDTVLITLIW